MIGWIREKNIYIHMLIAYAKQIMATCVNIAGENLEMVLSRHL